MGGMPGILPGQIALGHNSLLAGAPSITGGILSIDSSSLGNLNPASLNALPKSFSLGKSRWHVLQLVPYIRAKAGIAWLTLESMDINASCTTMPTARLLPLALRLNIDISPSIAAFNNVTTRIVVGLSRNQIAQGPLDVFADQHFRLAMLTFSPQSG